MPGVLKLEVVLPVYNEERKLERGVSLLYQFLKQNLDIPWRITIANNGSTDSTLALAQQLSRRYPGVEVTHIEQKGRGRALRRSWLQSEAEIVSYMDIDLSTGLEALPQLLQALEQADVVTGSRLLPTSRVERSMKRRLLTRLYNLLIGALFWTGFKDAQCGFKALRRPVAQHLIPLVRDQAWFFDTELLVLAVKKGYRVKEVPISWRESQDSRVKIIRTVLADLKGLLELRWRLWLRRRDG